MFLSLIDNSAKVPFFTPPVKKEIKTQDLQLNNNPWPENRANIQVTFLYNPGVFIPGTYADSLFHANTARGTVDQMHYMDKSIGMPTHSMLLPNSRGIKKCLFIFYFPGKDFY